MTAKRPARTRKKRATRAPNLGPYAQAALEYCQAVTAGEIVAGKWTRLACERQLRDWSHACDDAFPYYFDCDEANRKCARIELLPHIEGEWAARGETIKLGGWQCFLVATLFGWRHRDTGKRRFRTAHWEIARKNAKSTIAAGIALCLLDDDNEAGAQVYSAATKREQAKIVFNTARQMVLRAKATGAEWAQGIGVHANTLFVRDSASKFTALDAQGKRQDGLNPHGIINDELHAWEKRSLYAVLETAMGARQQPLMLNITTAGYNLGGVCYELRGYGQKLLEGTLHDESFFIAIWTIDEDDDPWDEKTWPKANPNYGVSVYPFDMQRLAKKAKEIPSEQTDFLTKRLNVWCNAEHAWMDMRKWDACADATMKLEQFAGLRCVAAIDVAEKRDVTARCLLFTKKLQGKSHYYAFMRYYLPEAAVRGANAGQYDGWVRRGLIDVTDGNIIDLDRVQADLVADSKKVSVREVAYDPHNATSLALGLQQKGIRPVEFRQTPMNFDEPMRWWEARVLDGTFHHTGCPVLTWMVSNVTIRKTGRMHEFLHPRKEREQAKIDGPVTICMALKRLMADEAGYSVYDHRGIITV